MPTVTVEWLPGRDLDQKREIVAEITDVLVRVGKTSPEAVQITFRDVTKENYARAGVLAVDQSA